MAAPIEASLLWSEASPRCYALDDAPNMQYDKSDSDTLMMRSRTRVYAICKGTSHFRK